ncbi:MAG: helix-turn-helix domain-containing protein [bacterium]
MIRRKTAPPRGVLNTAVADTQRYHHARYHPSADLELYVEHFWSVQWDLRDVAPERVESLPHPSVHMIFERNAGGRIAGVSRGKFSRMLEGQSGVFAEKFTPGGFYPFAGIPVSDLADTIVNVGDIFGSEGDALVLAVEAATDDATRVETIETFLRERRPAPDENVARISEIVYAAAADRTILKVEDLVERYSLSKRMLQRLFAKYVGATPKWVIQRYRLHEAAAQLAAGGSVNQSTLALNLGYSDQAHFVRDFKTIIGTTPAAYAKAVSLSRT